MKIAGSTFMITGGASGLGAATAERIVDQGGAVVIADLNEELGGQLAARLGVRARSVRVDVTLENDVQRAVELAGQEFGAIHGVVNCAGIAIVERTLGRTGPHRLESFSRVIQINLIGAFNVVRLTAAAMAQNEPGESGERGVIINTASVAAFDGQIGQAAYAASKAGVAGLTLPLARDLSIIGVRVVAIAPGTFDTPMLAGLPEPARQSLAQQVPFPQRLGRPDEYAALACHIIENQMLNGEVIRLDGAIRMTPK
jgi:NAD(P)-dependent dehydrogenase (short-subunit alcohol dehydrogenase family)